MMRTLLKPKPACKTAAMITQAENDAHYWLARLAVVLSHIAADPSPEMVKHARKTLDEFTRSTTCSDTLAQHCDRPKR